MCVSQSVSCFAFYYIDISFLMQIPSQLYPFLNLREAGCLGYSSTALLQRMNRGGVVNGVFVEMDVE